MLPSHGYATGWQDSLDDQIVHQAWIPWGPAEHQLISDGPRELWPRADDLEMDDAGLLGRLPAGFFQRFQDRIHLPGLAHYPLQNFPGTCLPRINNRAAGLECACESTARMTIFSTLGADDRWACCACSFVSP